MGKYIKKFSTDSDRVEYEGSNDYLEPYVSYVDGDNTVHYNKIETRLIATYNVTDASEPILIYAYYDEEGQEEYWVKGADLFTNAEIDGTEVSIQDLDTAQGQYQFSNGEHTVKYTLKDPTSIGDGAFAACSSLTSVTIPDSVTSIGSWVFQGCSGLISATIGNGVTSIGDGAFNDTSLISVIIPNNVTSISFIAFASCRNLTSVTIGNSVTSIGEEAFIDCSSLTSVTIEATTPPTLEANVFGNTNDCPIYVPAESVDVYKAASGWSEYASRIQAIQ